MFEVYELARTGKCEEHLIEHVLNVGPEG